MDFIKCKVADFNISFDNNIKSIDILLKNFLFDFSEADISLSISQREVINEKSTENAELSNGSFQRLAVFRKFAEQIPNYNAFVLHSACFDVDGVGVAFAAHSGTGKTTHMNLWQEYLGEKMVVVNGDKPIVRFFEEEPNTPYAYGTPWNGKEHLGCNMRTPLKHICFIERSETNFVEKISPSEAVERIFNQVYMPKDPAAMAKTIELINRLISSCNLWKIHCNMEPEAAEVAYNTIFKK